MLLRSYSLRLKQIWPRGKKFGNTMQFSTLHFEHAMGYYYFCCSCFIERRWIRLAYQPSPDLRAY